MTLLMLANDYFPCCSEMGSTCHQRYVGLEYTPMRLYRADPACRLQDKVSTVLTPLLRHDTGCHVEQIPHDGGPGAHFACVVAHANAAFMHGKVAWWLHMVYRDGSWPV